MDFVTALMGTFTFSLLEFNAFRSSNYTASILVDSNGYDRVMRRTNESEQMFRLTITFGNVSILSPIECLFRLQTKHTLVNENMYKCSIK